MLGHYYELKMSVKVEIIDGEWNSKISSNFLNILSTFCLFFSCVEDETITCFKEEPQEIFLEDGEFKGDMG